MSKYEVNMTYEPFSKEPEYIEANRAFVQQIDLEPNERILDLACGIGTMTDVMLEIKSNLTITGLDISRESLVLARTHFSESVFPNDQKAAVNLLQATAEVIPLKDQSVDAVIMGNSIHLLPDPHHLLREIRRVLHPGCVFAFNSSFYAGTMPAGTEGFNHEWIKQAAAYIMRKDLDLRKQGRPGITRKRGTVSSAFSKRWPTMHEWREILEEHEFEIKYIYERTVMMTQHSFETIGAYGGFAGVILSGYPVAEASEALQATVAPALAAVDMRIVPRKWLEIVAYRSR